MLKNSYIVAIVITGNAKIIVIIIALFLLYPKRSAAKMIIADLETPGINAIAWKTPIIEMSK